jgi:hypothetical protein
MTLLEPSLRHLFGADEHPEKSWDQLHPVDQAWARRIILPSAEDPGTMSYEQWNQAGADDRQRRLRRLEDWYKSWPFVRTRQVRDIERHLATLPEPQPHMDDDLLDVPLITGPPGTGKTTVMKQAAVAALARSAWGKRLDGTTTAAAGPLFIPDWRPVIFHSTDGNPRVKAFFAHLCDELSVPATTDPQAAFRRAVLRHGVQFVFIDEVQMINFDGQYGMYLHNALKALQNMNVRVVLSGHNVRQMLTRRETAAQNATQTQSIARWTFQDLNRYPHETSNDIAEWRGLLRGLEQHIRLAGHEEGTSVLSEDFEEHLWVTTLGYVNALAALLTGACLTASRTKTQRITAKIIDSIRLNERVSRGREFRLDSWRERRFNWATDASSSS